MITCMQHSAIRLALLLALAAGIVGCQTQAAPPPLTKAERLAKEKADLLSPFAKPHPFEPAGEGYKVVFPWENEAAAVSRPHS